MRVTSRINGYFAMMVVVGCRSNLKWLRLAMAVLLAIGDGGGWRSVAKVVGDSGGLRWWRKRLLAMAGGGCEVSLRLAMVAIDDAGG